MKLSPILLLAAYDKAADPSKLRQQTEIALARTRLKVLRALARAISSVTTSVERLEASNAEIQHRVAELERERG